MNTTVLYHDDNDGFGAAFAAWLRLKDNATYIPVQYGEPVPEIPSSTMLLYILDFSYKREICEQLAKKYVVHILDHHKTAEKELEGLKYAQFDMTKSGCMMSWEFFHDKADPPDLLEYVQDYDLWKFKLPYSEEINLCIDSLPRDFVTWQNTSNRNFFNAALDRGRYIKSFRDKQVDAAVKRAFVTHMELPGSEEPVDVVISNATDYISQVGHALLKAFPEAVFSMTYYDNATNRVWSLRSEGDFDVSEVANKFGGGGHKNAAGFVSQ